MASSEMKAACLRVYLWAPEYTEEMLDGLTEAVADLLVEQGFGNVEDETMRSMLLVTPESLPLDDETAFVEATKEMRAGMIVFPDGTGHASGRRDDEEE